MIGRSWRSGGGALLRARFHQVRRGAALRPQSRRPPRRHLLLLSRPRAVIGRSPARVPRVCNVAARRRLALGVRSARSNFPQCRLAALSSRGRFAATPEHSPAGASSAAAFAPAVLGKLSGGRKEPQAHRDHGCAGQDAGRKSGRDDVPSCNVCSSAAALQRHGRLWNELHRGETVPAESLQMGRPEGVRSPQLSPSNGTIVDFTVRMAMAAAIASLTPSSVNGNSVCISWKG